MPLRLSALYERLQQSARLAGVHQTFGAPTDAGPLSTPRICWVPTADEFAAGENEHVPSIEAGQQVYLTQRAERQAGVELRLYAEGAPLAAHRVLEALLDQVVLALDDEQDLAQALRVEGARWLSPPECPPGTSACALALRLLAPIYDEQPAAAATGTTYQYEAK